MLKAFPGADQSFQPFFARKPPHKQRIFSPPISFARVTSHKVRLHHDLFARQPPLNKFFPRKLGEGNVAVHHSGPGAQPTVDGEHESNPSRFCSRVTVAAVAHAAPQAVVGAFLANLATAKKLACRAEEP